MVAQRYTGSTAVADALTLSSCSPVPYRPYAVTHLRHGLTVGRPWAQVLLEAVGLWTAPREVVDERELVYLIGGEAFDWLALAERLLAEVPDGVPPDERDRLLFRGELPPGTTPGCFKEALGVTKYRAHLNFFYGVVVEEALWLAVEREVVKERGVRGLQHGTGVHDLVSQRLYGAKQDALLRQFRRAQGQRLSIRFSLTEWKELTYGLFKQRLGKWDAARIASDTRKGLRMLQELRDEAGQDRYTATAPMPPLS